MRDRRRFLALVAVAAIVGMSCAQPADKKAEAPALDPVKVKADIEAANVRFTDALKNGDKPGMTANYAADAVLMMPGAPMVQGTAAIDKAFNDFSDQFTLKEGGTTTTDVMLAGDLAIETGTFAWTLKPKKGPDVTDKGKYLTVWKHQADGSWKILRDINNTDLAAK